MLLPTMTDEEMCFEAFRVTPSIRMMHDDLAPGVLAKFRDTKNYPRFSRHSYIDDKRNEWRMTFWVQSKPMKRKGLYGCVCYTIYEIPRKPGVDPSKDTNSGRGILMFDPRMDTSPFPKDTRRSAMFWDIVPHAFNRYTQYYLKPQGKADMEFDRKVESVITRWRHFDTLGDKSSEKHTDKGFASIDIYMKDGGMLRGQYVNGCLTRIFTYISEDMMYDNQIERQKEMEREYWQWKRLGLYK